MLPNGSSVLYRNSMRVNVEGLLERRQGFGDLEANVVGEVVSRETAPYSDSPSVVRRVVETQ